MSSAPPSVVSVASEPPLAACDSRWRGLIATPARCWTFVACVAFAFATAYAIAVVIFRLPLPGLQEPRLFRIALALHVELAVFFWLMATSAAVWSAAARSGASRLAPACAGGGTLLVAASPIFGGEPLMADYFPWLDGNPLMPVGFTLFCAAIVLAAGAAAWRTLRGMESAEWRGAGLSALPVLAAAATAAIDYGHGARDIATLAWGAGHTLLFAHVALMCWEWGRLADPANRLRVPRLAAAALATVSVTLPLIAFIHEPGTPAHQYAYTLTMSWLLWPPVIVAGIAALRAIRRGGSPDNAGLVIGLAFAFSLVGNLLGAAIDGATTLVTAHYHAAIGAVALTRMGFAYSAAASLSLARPGKVATRRQLLTYATALLLLVTGLAVGAVDAAPRKTSAGELATRGPFFKTGMSIAGVGGLFAIAGSLWFVLNLTRSTGERRISSRNARPG